MVCACSLVSFLLYNAEPFTWYLCVNEASIQSILGAVGQETCIADLYSCKIIAWLLYTKDLLIIQKLLQLDNKSVKAVY